MDWKKKIKHGLIAVLGHTFIALLLHSCRLRVHGVGKKREGAHIFIFWHRHLLYMMFHFRHMGARPLVSLSEDGEMISSIAQRFGMNPIRGSSSRGGARALLELIAIARNSDKDILITADGPKGPLRQVKPGLVKLAEKSGAPVVPVCWRASRCWVLRRSWDQFVIPKPFSRIDLFLGPALDIVGMDERKVTEILKELEKKNHCD